MTTRRKTRGEPSGLSITPNPRPRVVALLLGILLLATALRVPLLRSFPPGLHQDEAINAWDAYCLLKTGNDSNGVRWPIFYTHGFGSNRSALFLYLLLPFQLVGGLGVETARLAAALYGVVAVALMYYVGARLFGASTGLLAAGLLAVVPWHVQLTRNANEPTICVLLVVLPLAALLKARLPFLDGEERAPSVAWAGLAGVLAGACCYGYAAVRLFLPVFLVGAVVATWRSWWRCLQTRRGAQAIGALALGVAATFGPLAWKHVVDSANIAQRGDQNWVWDKNDPLSVRASKVAERYPLHFGLDFLFRRGDHFEIQAPPGGGQLRWFMLPLLLAGAIATMRRAGTTMPARLLLAWVVIYPAGDLLNESLDGYPHALRSLPGLGGLVLLAAVGGVAGWHWLAARNRRAAVAAAVALAALAAFETARFCWLFSGEFVRRPMVYHLFHVDLMAALERLRPRFEAVDAVFCTTEEMRMPYTLALVSLAYEPSRWFAEPHKRITIKEWDFYIQVGKLNFLYWRDWQPAFNALKANGRDDHVVFIVRPGQLGLRDCPERIDGPPGTLPLLICEEVI